MSLPRGWMVLSLLMVVGALLMGTGATLADGPTVDAAPGTVPATATASPDGQVVVSRWVTDAAGQPVKGQKVSFYLEADFLGHSQVLLGSATTDATGIAQIRYTPTWEGTQVVVARLAGDNALGGADTTIAFDVAGARAAHVAEPPALGGLRTWTPVIVGTVVVLVWGTMALVVVRTVQGIRSASRRPEVGGWTYPARSGAAIPHSSRR